MADVQAQVVKLLRGREAKRIKFTFPGGSGDITVNKDSFETVAAAIDAGTVTVNGSATLPANVGAQYHPDTNVIDVPPIIGRVQQAYIMHEAVHACFDLNSTSVQDAAEESAAYVVADLYAKMTGLKDARFSGPPFDAARPIATQLLSFEAKGTPGTATVDTTAWTNLVSTVVSIPVYSSMGVTASSTLYTHDG